MDKISALQTDLIRGIISNISNDYHAGHTPQPVFIVGSSGAGKSTIINLLAQSIEKGIKDIEVISLDGKNFFESHEIISAIEGDKHRDPKNPQFLGTQRRIVIIDDLDYYFKRSSYDDQSLLRSYLNEESAPLLIATLSRIDDALADYNAPFFEGIRVFYIPAVSISDLNATNQSDETLDRISHLLQYLPPVVRSLKTATEIVQTSSDPNRDLQELIILYSPLYREKFESLPVYSQKILKVLAKQEEATLTELREFTGLPSGILSTYLRQLLKATIIQKIGSKKKGNPYRITDKLFREWLR